MANKIILKDINAAYGAVQVLHGISMDVGHGETVALLGTNGNGKSTLIKVVAGLVKSTQGTALVVIDDVEHNLAGLTPEEIVNLGVAMVPEGRRLFPLLTVEENLLLGASRPFARAHVDETMAFCFEVFPKLKERRTQRAGSMSGGEQQMLAVSRALMGDPKLLLLDEPSMGLAPVLVELIFDTIVKIRKQGVTILLIEQNATAALDVADRAYVLESGKVKISGTAKELSADDKVTKAYLGH